MAANRFIDDLPTVWQPLTALASVFGSAAATTCRDPHEMFPLSATTG
jgi:hypothetical protein